ncbi:MAG TPA: GyrI-like domain-containing protein [Anaerolineales bacterium]|nr:GyrI-like domain-containing protein [Anaerolineales bacterium]HLB49295.1 GyrI-like domain-containing protein [Anaerolineales bacterium]
MELAVPVGKAAVRGSTPPTAHMAVRELPGVETMATVIHKGDLWDVGQTITSLYTWIGANGFMSSGPYRELHIFWRELDIEPSAICDIVLEMQVPVSRLDSHVA